MTRRRSIQLTVAASLAAGFMPWSTRAARVGRGREFEVCLSPETVLQEVEFRAALRQAGVSRVWLAGFFYGHWPSPVKSLVRAREALAEVVNVPLGHPGDSLGARDGNFPLTPPRHWRLGVGLDGREHAGTSLHAPATEENRAALRELRRAGFSRFFLDDDFRLARGPGEIGGCFCSEHRTRFLRRTGFPEARWPELRDDARARRPTRLLREWLEFTCDELTASFRAQNRAAGGGLGIMVMYLGAEKAGIRLRDYRAVPLRVGELMFNDSAFSPLKGKTDELFSVLFHRRFVAPELAYSETTAFPADRLSARHLAAKLVISTLADVRHTVFMSGVTPFPKAHWTTLAPAMRRQADFHARLAGHRPRGPFKHYWGEASRLVGDDRPFSLFLATGIPFEVADELPHDGWTFLSDADARSAAGGRLAATATRWVCRPQPQAPPAGAETCEESLEALWALKRRLLPRLRKTPWVETAEPAVLAWYPSARAALLWNPHDARKTFAVRCGAQVREVTVQGLDAALIQDLREK